MQKNISIAILAITAFLAGCTEQKDDFVGISFDMKQTELEAQNFICKKGKDDITCKNFDREGSVFGYQTKGVRVTFLNSDKRACCITVDLPSETVQLKKMLNLFSNINSVYTHMPERDFKEGSILLREWNAQTDQVSFLWRQKALQA